MSSAGEANATSGAAPAETIAVGCSVKLFEKEEYRDYSVGEAQSYAQAQIEYCDNVEAEYPAANMASLRQAAAEFLAILQRQPLDWERMEALHRRLQAGVGVEGSGWTALFGYVTYFVRTITSRQRERLS